MKKNLLYIIFTFCICFLSCKKNTLPPEDDAVAPDFYFKCDVNGLPINIQAGVNNYYMYSLHEQNADSIYVYRGDLKQKNCGANCSYGISVQINDYKISALNAPMKPDSGLYTGNYQFNDGVLAPLYYSAYFSPLTTSSNNTNTWRYSDSTSQTSLQGFKVFRTNTIQNVMLAVNQTSPTCSITHTNTFYIGNALQTNISAVRDTSNNYSFLRYTFSSNPTTSITGTTYFWEFGDGATSSLSNPTHNYSSQNYYRPKLTLSNATNTCVTYYQAPCFNYSVCNANYNAYFNSLANPKALSAITIKVIDPSGIEYSSSTLNQPSTNKFEIISIENYKLNEKNEATKKLKIKFNCTLQNGTNTLNITNGEAVIAVSYK